MKRGFKLVFNAAGQLTSLNCPTEGRVEYSTTQWTRPKRGCGPLFVFKLLKIAQNMQRSFGGEVWECEYVPFRGRLRWTSYGLIAGWVWDMHSPPHDHLPEWLRLASRVRLVRRVS